MNTPNPMTRHAWGWSFRPTAEPPTLAEARRQVADAERAYRAGDVERALAHAFESVGRVWADVLSRYPLLRVGQRPPFDFRTGARRRARIRMTRGAK